jgi:hypothetical protein
MKEINTNEDGIFKFLSNEEIDEMMKKKIDALRSEDNFKKWTENEILYRRKVIYDYISQGL